MKVAKIENAMALLATLRILGGAYTRIGGNNSSVSQQGFRMENKSDF